MPMEKEKKSLARAFEAKEEVEGFLVKLERLRADESVPADQYEAIKEEYEQRLRSATDEIEAVRGQLGQQLEAKQAELDDERAKLDRLEIKQKVGELSTGDYENTSRELRARIEGLEGETADLRKLSEAGSSAEVASVKSPLEKRRDERQREIRRYELELDRVEVKYKVGEIDVEEYRASARDLRTRIRALQGKADGPGPIGGARPSAGAFPEPELSREAGSAGGAGAVLQRPVSVATERPSVSAAAGLTREPAASGLGVAAEAGPPLAAGFGARLLTPWTRVLAMVFGVLLLVSVLAPWVGASAQLGQGLGTDTAREISPLLAMVGIAGGLVVLGTAFLPRGRSRGKAQITVSILALLALLAIILLGVLPLTDEYARSLIVLKGGFYLYALAAVVLFVNGVLERRRS